MCIENQIVANQSKKKQIVNLTSIHCKNGGFDAFLHTFLEGEVGKDSRGILQTQRVALTNLTCCVGKYTVSRCRTWRFTPSFTSLFDVCKKWQNDSNRPDFCYVLLIRSDLFGRLFPFAFLRENVVGSEMIGLLFWARGTIINVGEKYLFRAVQTLFWLSVEGKRV